MMDHLKSSQDNTSYQGSLLAIVYPQFPAVRLPRRRVNDLDQPGSACLDRDSSLLVSKTLSTMITDSRLYPTVD